MVWKKRLFWGFAFVFAFYFSQSYAELFSELASFRDAHIVLFFKLKWV
jgi:hypothetical protein